MSHPDEGLLQELLDGELAFADAATVRAHLATCASCTALLDGLQETQEQATAIVDRLDLDPPMVRRDWRGAAPARRFNPRIVGIAASFLLVAGTAWVLRGSFGPRPQADGAIGDAIIAQRDTGSSVAESVDTVTSRAGPVNAPVFNEVPVTASARSDAGAARKSIAAPAAPASPPVVPKAVAGAPVEATDAEAAPTMSLAEAGSRLGAPVATIQGLSPTAVELLDAAPDSAAGVRLVYLVDGTRVTLSQRAAKRGAGVVTAPAPAAVATDRARDEVTAKQAAKATPASRTWETNGLVVTLEGMLPPDSLAALARRVH